MHTATSAPNRQAGNKNSIADDEIPKDKLTRVNTRIKGITCKINAKVIISNRRQLLTSFLTNPINPKTKIKTTFFLGKILHLGFFYSIRILPKLETSENGPLSININMECRAKQVRYPPPSARAISNRLHMYQIKFLKIVRCQI